MDKKDLAAIYRARLFREAEAMELLYEEEITDYERIVIARWVGRFRLLARLGDDSQVLEECRLLALRFGEKEENS